MSRISLEKIEAIAPDQASLMAARKLVKVAGWSGLSCDKVGHIWGECQGSGSSPYRVVANEIDAGYKCSCPSRKFPCKHSLALMWMRAEGRIAFIEAQTPEWVHDWVRRRRPASGAGPQEEPVEASHPKDLAKAATETVAEIDPKAEARAAAARERARRDREEAVLAGLDDLDRWIGDQIDSGLLGFAAQAGKNCRSIAQRLVDAKASGLASRIDGLPARIYALPDPMRATAALEQLGQLHLLAQAYRRQQLLRDPLREDVRREIGWTQSREALLGDERALTVSATWRVLASLSEIQPDRLRRLETWLWREDLAEAPQIAVLIDFVPVAAGPTRSAYQTGERLGATLVFYPSERPLRALVREVTGPAQESSANLNMPENDLAASLAQYEDALARLPWLAAWPMAFRHAHLRRSGDRLLLCAAGDEHVAFPLLAAQNGAATPLLAIDSLDGFGLWDGYSFRLCLAQTSLGRWVAE